jgi:hypothetical protein
MMKFVVGVVIVLMLVNRTSGQCVLDLNHDDATTVDEIIIAINQAIDGCPGSQPTTQPTSNSTATPIPTPTNPPSGACPFDFNNNNANNTFCGYAGPLTNSCHGTATVAAGWQSNGSSIATVLADQSGSIGLVATKTSATSGRVVSVAAGPDFNQSISASGTVSLPSAQQFNVSFNSAASCVDGSLAATFVKLLTPSQATALGSAPVAAIASLIAGQEQALPPPAPVDIEGLLQRFLEKQGVQ